MAETLFKQALEEGVRNEVSKYLSTAFEAFQHSHDKLTEQIDILHTKLDRVLQFLSKLEPSCSNSNTDLLTHAISSRSINIDSCVSDDRIDGRDERKMTMTTKNEEIANKTSPRNNIEIKIQDNKSSCISDDDETQVEPIYMHSEELIASTILNADDLQNSSIAIGKSDHLKELQTLLLNIEPKVNISVHRPGNNDLPFNAPSTADVSSKEIKDSAFDNLSNEKLIIARNENWISNGALQKHKVADCTLLLDARSGPYQTPLQPDGQMFSMSRIDSDACKTETIGIATLTNQFVFKEPVRSKVERKRMHASDVPKLKSQLVDKILQEQQLKQHWLLMETIQSIIKHQSGGSEICSERKKRRQRWWLKRWRRRREMMTMTGVMK
jgi:hypothetical protein